MADLLDKDIREIIFTYFEEHYEKLRIVEEKPIGKCRCDFMVITPTAIFGCEIKSNHDTYSRLEQQIKAYDRFFDSNYCIVGEKHKKGVFNKLPSHWGVILVDNSGDVSVLREPTPRKRSVLKSQLSFLWRNELVNILQRNNMPKYVGKSKRYIVGRLIERLEAQKLKEELCDELFERDYTLWDFDD